ncbi:WUSCHEL-related homeobox 9 [Apostasia shenzhenica]|uniref:WUSCHEL-related homeobox 9 n=1 Tax=Apostasia shenzhenica TaxID=1088818 RepID=A0A2H9ZZL8_9ASPA|nr:WUSCHEL-related homeobox 9 [Apostasia shenzhenica]
MASSNRHWPSLFKSKPSSCAASAHHQWPHDIISPCQKPNSYSPGVEERAPEPKPRWNPKPEQIRILEAIFNSGMVNPPRDEIRRIRAQLQEYGQVGDANVFYWFQNRKSRSKHKQRHLKSAAAAGARSSTSSANPPASAPPPAATSSSSSSSDRSSSGSDKQILPLSAASGDLSAMLDLSASPTPSVNQYSLFHNPLAIPELSLEASLYLPAIPPSFSGDFPSGVPASALWGDLLMPGVNGKNAVLGGLGLSFTDPSSSPDPPPPFSPNLTTTAMASELQAAARSTVFINEVAYELFPGPVNVREAFGEEAILLHSSGQPVLTDEWGLTLQPLQHGASYYLVNLLSIDL